MFPSRWKLVSYSLIILIGCLIAAPNLLTRQQLAALPAWLPKKQVTLGLDLRGGSHLVVEIDAAALAREQLDTLVDRARSALREARIGATVSVSSQAVVARIADETRRAEAERILRKLVSTVSLSAFTEAQRDLDVTLRPDGTIELRPTQAATLARRNAAVDQSLEIVRKRIDEVGVAEPTIQRLGADRILVQLPGVQDPKMVRDILGRTAKMSFHRVWTLDTSGGRLPPGYEMLPASNGQGAYPVERQPMLQGDRLADAAAGFDHRTGQPIVTFRFDTAGARRFAEITRAHVGEPFAIVLDGKVLSAPVIQEPITGGAGQISGSFTVAETTSLAALLAGGGVAGAAACDRGAHRRSRPRHAMPSARGPSPVSPASPSSWFS